MANIGCIECLPIDLVACFMVFEQAFGLSHVHACLALFSNYVSLAQIHELNGSEMF